jgi:hypothetical protein
MTEQHSRDEPQPESRRAGLESFLGDRYPSSWEWRDGLGCVWFVGLGAILTIAIWLGKLGVPGIVLQIGTVAAIVGMLIGFWLLGRSRRQDE